MLTVAYLLRLYTRSRLYKSIIGRIDENARKRNPDIGDEALPTGIIVRQVYADMDVIVRPLVDAISKDVVDIIMSIVKAQMTLPTVALWIVRSEEHTSELQSP